MSGLMGHDFNSQKTNLPLHPFTLLLWSQSLCRIQLSSLTFIFIFLSKYIPDIIWHEMYMYGIHWSGEQLRGHSVSSKHTPGFQWSFAGDLWLFHLTMATPHTLCQPAFTFHKIWRRLSVSVEHRAKLNISLSVSLPSAFLPRLLEVFFPFSRRLTTDCFFSPPQTPSFITKLCLFWWAATGPQQPGFNSQGQSCGI